MVQHFDDSSKEEPELSPSFLEELEVPSDYPVELMNFTKRTRGICKDGGHETVGALIAFLQNNKNALIMNEEFSRFYSNILHMDKIRLRQFLPIRKESKGIFLAEAIGNISRRLKDKEAATLVNAYTVATTKVDWSENSVLPKSEALILIKEMKRTLEKCFEQMPDQAQELRCAIESGINSSVRFFVSLNDPDFEGLALAMTKAALDVKPRFKGFIGNF